MTLKNKLILVGKKLNLPITEMYVTSFQSDVFSVIAIISKKFVFVSENVSNRTTSDLNKKKTN